MGAAFRAPSKVATVWEMLGSVHKNQKGTHRRLSLFGRPLRRPAFGAILFGNVARYLAPQLAFLLKVGAASLIGGLSGHPFALFGFVCVVRAEGHPARLRPWRLTNLVKIEQSAN